MIWILTDSTCECFVLSADAIKLDSSIRGDSRVVGVIRDICLVLDF